MRFFFPRLKDDQEVSISTQTFVLWFFLFFFLNVAFLFWMNNYFYENGVYLKYFQSILKDGDFNIFNQCESQFDTWMATGTYNHPDYHSPFIASLLLIPFIFFKIFLPITVDNSILGLQLFFSLALLPIVILHGYFKHGDLKIKCLSFLMFLSLSTPWFTFVDPSELSMICLIFSMLLFFECKKVLSDNKYSASLLYLIVFFFCLIRADGIFYSIGIISMFLINKDFKKALSATLALFLGISQILIVNKLRFGVFTTHNPVILLDHFYLMPYLFGPNGLFVKSPFIVVALSLLFLHLIKTQNVKERSLPLLALVVIFLKIIFLSFNLTPITNYIPSRHYITELPIIIYCAWVVCKSSKTWLILLFPFVCYNFYDLFSFLLHEKTNYNYFFNRYISWETIQVQLPGLTRFVEWKLNYFSDQYPLILILSLVGAMFLATVFWLQAKGPHTFRWFLLCFLVGTTFVFSGLNFINNKKAAASMKQQGLFEKTVIAEGDGVYYDEVLDIIELVRSSEKYYGIPEKNYIDSFQKKYIETVKESIIIDPVDFKKNLEQGILRKSFWQLKNL